MKSNNGSEKDQYQILWVQHQEKVNQDTDQTRLELNFFIPNVEPINAIERGNTEPRTASPESSGTEKTDHFEYGADFSSSYFAYSDFLAWFRHQKQIQRSEDTKYRDQRETNEGRTSESIGGQYDFNHMQTNRQQSPTTVSADQQECRGMAGWIMIPMGY